MDREQEAESRKRVAGGSGQALARFDFDTVDSRVGTHSEKFDRPLRHFGPGSIEIGMGVADMDFRAAPAITAALRDRMSHEVWGYLDMPRHFVDGIIEWNRHRYAVTIEPDQLVIAEGVHPALVAALRAFAPRGSQVLMLTPVYNGFYADLAFLGLHANESPLAQVDGRSAIDFEDVESRIGPDTGAFILCNPHNPTGNCWSADDLTRLGAICLRHGVVVLADEIHCDFVWKGQHYTPFASLPDTAIVDNSITFKAASKSFGLAAHKVAWFHSTNPSYLARVKAEQWVDANTLGVVANAAAYAGGEDWLDQLVAYLEDTHDFVTRFIAERMPLIAERKPEGTYLAWLDVSAVSERIRAKAQAEEETRRRGRPVTPEQIIERYFVSEAKVHLSPGSYFGLGGANHMRMNIATSRTLVERALVNMSAALDRT